MGLHELTQRIGKIDALDKLAGPWAGLVKRLVGKGLRKDLLSGTYLGHPLHPLLTDIPIGCFSSAAALDILGGRQAQDAADLLVALGLVSGFPTAASGAADWSDSYGAEQRIGAVHAIANFVGLGFYAASLVARRRGRRSRGVLLGFAGMGAMTAGGFLGGHLVFAQGVGVSRAFDEHGPGDWTPVGAAADLRDGQPLRVDAGDASILLLKSGEKICAISSRCTHAGGPLDEGNLDLAAGTVECPWRQSVFRLDGGSVVHGPATAPQPAYEVRVEDGQVEVRTRA
jgi:nitrite reductase/ring-hydroxylating ferredoxin subunit/uncharacterized membrane protein